VYTRFRGGRREGEVNRHASPFYHDLLIYFQVEAVYDESADIVEGSDEGVHINVKVHAVSSMLLRCSIMLIFSCS
jgi:hypothetical protein